MFSGRPLLGSICTGDADDDLLELQMLEAELGSDSTPGVSPCALSSDSRKLFRRFMRGYTRVQQKGAADKDGALVDFLADATGDAPEAERARSRDGDHYAYFAHLHFGNIGNPGDNDRRLRSRRAQLWQTRALCQPKGQSGDRPGAAVRRNSIEGLEWAQSPGSASSGGGRFSIAASPLASPLSSAAGGGRRTLGEDPSATSPQQASAMAKVELRNREACESLRFLVFGTTGADGKRGKDGAPTYDQKCGTKEEVLQLHRVWDQMDEDGSGDVEFQEFISFFSRRKVDRLLGMRCVNYLVGKARSSGANELDKGCTVEDMMRLIWLKATDSDIDKMMGWFCEVDFLKERVPAPRLLPKRKRRAILENFPKVDWREPGGIPWNDLMAASHIDAATMQDLRVQYGKADYISENDLLEMLCPRGYRAHKDVKTAVDKAGRSLVCVTYGSFAGWITAGKASKWTSLHESAQQKAPGEP